MALFNQSSAPKKDFISSLTKGLGFSNTPKQNMSVAPKLPVTTAPKIQTTASNQGATGTTKPVITHPKTPPNATVNTSSLNTPQAKTYMSNLTTPAPGTPAVANVPTAPEVKEPSSKDAYISAYKSYIDSLKESADIKEAKQAYLDFAKSRDLGQQKIKDQTIPMKFITGQQKSLAETAGIEEANLLNKIGIAQDTQKATQDSLKAGVDMYGKLIEEDKPVEVGGVLYGKQADGTYKALVGTPKGAEGFTLGKDQVRYDAQGNVIAGTVGGGNLGETDNALVGAYVKGIQSGQYKLSDVPDSLKDAVVQGVSTQPKAQSEISKQVGTVIDELLAKPDILNKISGPIDQYLGGIIGPEAILAKNKYNQLKGLLSLDNIKYLKGTGAISDAEQKLLADAASAIGRNLYGTQLASELQKLKAGLQSVGGATAGIQPDEEAYLKSKGYSDQEIQSLKGFNSVGNTSASNLPQKNKNPGNVKKGGLADSLAIGTDKQGHLIFPTEEAGFKALALDIVSKIDGKSKYLPKNPTLAQLGKVYAEDPNWSKSVAKILGVSPLTNTKNIDINKLTKAIARQEGYYA